MKLHWQALILISCIFHVGYLFSSTSTVAGQPAFGSASGPTNHLIRLIGIQSEYQNADQARAVALRNLRTITGHDIIMDSFDPKTHANWHSANISALPGCPEQEIRNLQATIKQDGGLTRKFKMVFVEDFKPPDVVTIDWLGACENVGRKRSQADDGAGGTGDNGNSTAIGSNNDDRAREETLFSTAATEAPSFFASTTEEPRQPSTTVEPTTPDNTFVSASTDSPTTAATTEVSGTTLFNSEEGGGLSQVDPIVMPSFFGNSTLDASEQTPSVKPTTPDNSTDNSLVSAATDSPTTNDANTTEVSGSTTTVANLTERGDDIGQADLIPPLTASSTVDPNEPATSVKPAATPDSTTDFTFVSVPTDSPPITTTTKTEVNGLLTKPDNSEEEGAAIRKVADPILADYGKYIGFGAGFIIFFAYVICSRSYRRQGMYELHTQSEQ